MNDVIPEDGQYRFSVSRSGNLFVMELDAEDELDAVYSTFEHQLEPGSRGFIAVVAGKLIDPILDAGTPPVQDEGEAGDGWTDGAYTFVVADDGELYVYRPDAVESTDFVTSIFSHSLSPGTTGTIEIRGGELQEPVPSSASTPASGSDDEIESVHDEWEREQQVELAAELAGAREESYTISITRLGQMVARNAPSSAKRMPFFASEGVLAVGDGQPLQLLNYFGERMIHGFVRFERNRLKPNEVTVENVENPGSQDTTFIVPRLREYMDAVGEQQLYPYPDLERITITMR